MSEPPLQARFVADVLTNPVNAALLDRWDTLALPDAWLVAGCLFQTVWNRLAGLASTHGIRDYDLFYFDAAGDADAEQAVQARVDALTADLGVRVEAVNQARVHLWYERDFGYPYTPLANSREAIGRFLLPATCVGLRPDGAGWTVCAPFGLTALYAGQLAPHPSWSRRALYEAKARSYQARWPWLTLTAAA